MGAHRPCHRRGEVVPGFFVGATFGCAVGPLASILLSVELFGSSEIVYFVLSCGSACMLSGCFGLYSSQKITYFKLKAELNNVHAR